MTRTKPEAGLETVRVGLPAGVKLAAPYNHDPALLDALEPVAAHLASVYLPVHPSAAASGRPFRGARSPAAYAADLERIARRCERMGIGLTLLANAPGWAVDARAVARTARALRHEVARLRVTLADLTAARRVRGLLPWVEIGVSTLADVRTPVEACWWRDEAGAAHVTVSRELNRRPDRLARLAATGMRLGIVSYDDCVPGCQFRASHVRPVPAAGGRRGWITSSRCLAGAARRARPWLLAQKEVLPGHLVRLAGLVGEVKVTGRDQETREVVRRLRLYLEARSLDHPSDLYSEPPGAWATIAGCDRDCHRCAWCADHLRALAPVFEGPDDAGRRRTRSRPGVDLVGPGGARIRVTLGPVDADRPPLRTVGDCGLYYGTDRPVDGALVEAVVGRIADRLEAAGGSAPDRLAKAAAAGPLPGGFRPR